MRAQQARRSPTRAVRTRSHWVALTLVLMALLVAMLVNGYTHRLGGLGASDARLAGTAASVPDAVKSGPVIDARARAEGGEQARVVSLPRGTVALTFDDGPDPEWTPKVLDLLRANGVHATFFVTGSAVLDHPGLVRRMVEEGHEVGLHSFSHVDLGAASSWRRAVEMRAAQQALIGAAGVSSALVRPPYSSTPAAVDDLTWAGIRASADEGYVTVLSTLDAKDWSRPGVPTIARELEAAGTGQSGDIVLLHDAGGDRAQTVEALREVLPLWLGRGTRVASVGEVVGMSHVMAPSPWGERLAGQALGWFVRLSEAVVQLIGWGLVASGAVMLVRAALVLVAARAHRRRSSGRHRAAAGRHRPDRPPARSLVTEPVTVVVPAYNEAAGIEATVRSIAASTHPVQIIVVDDGSSDDTARIVEQLALPTVTVVRKPNGGKPSALNEGLTLAEHELVVMVDGDTVFEPHTVHHLVQPFADERVGAVSGNTKVANRGGVLGAWQHIEYVTGFNLDRRMFDLAECMPTVPGAIGAFRRAALARVGGVSDDTLAEDTDLTMALCRDGWRVVYCENAIAWTEAPASLGALWRQRYRWCYGTMQAMWKHRGAVLQRGPAGKLGRRGLGYLLFLQVLLPMFAPVVDLFALYGIVFLDPIPVIGVWLGFLAVQLAMAIYAFRLDREPLRPLWTLALQQVVYRQLMYLVVIQSVFTALAGTRLRWHRSERYGTFA